MFTTHNVHLYTDDGLAMDDHPAVFNVDIERVARPSHPDGPSRGDAVEVFAEIYRTQIGGLMFDRDALVAMCGAAHVAAEEARVADEIAEQAQAGELAA